MKQKTIKWNTGSAARRFRALIKDSKKYNPSLTKKLKKLQAASSQASKLSGPGRPSNYIRLRPGFRPGGPAHKESGSKLDRSNWGLPRIIK